MLTYLRVRNLGLIEEASIQPSDRLTVITGETGTGKTLLLGALRLLMGDKPNNSAVGPFGDAIEVEGMFQLPDVEIGVSRTVPQSGRSRAFLEGKVVSASVLAREVAPLIVIAGQHEHVTLGAGATLLNLIDGVVADSDPGVRSSYGEAWTRLERLKGELQAVGGDALALTRELDLARHQVSEIDAANITDLSDEDAEALGSRLRNLDAIRDEVSSLLSTIEEIGERSGPLVTGMRRLADLDPGVAEDAELAESIGEQVAELRRSLAAIADDIEVAESDRVAIEDRLNRVGELKRRYGRTLEEVRVFRDAAHERADELSGLIDRAGKLDGLVAEATSDLLAAAKALTDARSGAAARMTEVMRVHLADLGLERAVVEVALESIEPNRSGSDRATIRFASDERLDPGPISTVASGGELSRLVLAVRLATDSDSATTLVFDEADAGIGGATALALGEKLAALSGESQVIAVTHLPQVAAHADIHYVVDRDDSGASVREVTGDDRVVELSRMLAGMPESPGGREAASELLAAARR